MDSNNIGNTLVAIGDITYCVVFKTLLMLLESDHFFLSVFVSAVLIRKKGGKRSFE